MKLLGWRPSRLQRLSAFEKALLTLQPHVFSTIVRYPSLHTFKLIINLIVYNRKPFVAPLRSVLNEFNGFMKLAVWSVVKLVLPDLKKFFDFRLRAIFTVLISKLSTSLPNRNAFATRLMICAKNPTRLPSGSLMSGSRSRRMALIAVSLGPALLCNEKPEI